MNRSSAASVPHRTLLAGGMPRDAWVDFAVVATLIAIGVLELTVGGPWRLGHGPAAQVLNAAATLGLLLRRRHPAAAIGAIAALALLTAPLRLELTMGVYLAMLLAAYSVTVRSSPGVAVAGVALAEATAGTQLLSASHIDVGDVLFTFLPLLAATGAGVAMRQRHRDIDRLRSGADQRVREAVEDERARIASELHDVVAHSMTVMVLQAGAARRVIATDPGAGAVALATIEAAGRQGLVEMRRLLQLMRPDDAAASANAPQPGLSDLDELAERVRAAGTPVTMEVIPGEVALGPGLQLSAYRIVQESLTNAMKHAPDAACRVMVRWVTGGSLDVAVVSEAAPAQHQTRAEHAGGFGLVSMRERARVFGGTLEAGPRGADFAVRAAFPLT